jgi:alpha-1,6-mannosyltransferase
MLTRASVRWSLLGLTGTFLLAASLFGGQDEGPFSSWVSIIIAASIACGLLVCLTAAAWRRQTPGRFWPWLVILSALAFRIALLPASHDLSDDAYRYHWDGKVLAHGINPYLHAPDDEAVSHLKNHEIDRRINHPWYRTCYPPFAQVIFAVGYLLSPGRLAGLQVLALIAELAAWLLLIRSLRRRRSPSSYLLLAAWFPLLMFQSYLPGHLDVFLLPFTTLFILATARGRALLAGIALALACLIKPLPLLLLPAALRELGWRKSWRLAMALAAVMLVFYLPFLGAGWRLFSSTWLMATAWSFGGSLASLLEGLLPMQPAHFLAGSLLGAALVLTAWRGRDLISRMQLALAAFVICTPTLFPWYLIVMFPLLVLRPDPALLALAVLIPVADEVVIQYHASQTWSAAGWPAMMVYGSFYSVLIVGACRGWGMFRRDNDRADVRVTEESRR